MKLCVIADQASADQESVLPLNEAGADAVAVAVTAPGDLLGAVAGQRPDVVVVDIALTLPGESGDATTLVAPLQALGVRVLVLVDPSDRPHLFAAIAAGADGIVARDASANELVATARQLLDGATVIGEGVRAEIGAEVHRQRTREEAEPAIHPQRSRARNPLSRKSPL